MNQIFERIKKEKCRLKSTFKFFKNYYSSYTDIFQADLLAVELKSKLRMYQHPSSENEVVLDQLVEAVMNSVLENNRLPTFKRIAEKEYEHISHIIQKFCVLAAVAAFWELQIKFFAGKTEIDVYRNNTAGEHLETRYLKHIVEGIKAQYPHFNANLELPMEIRNSLIHGNLQQLKTIILPTLSEDQKTELNTKMFVLNLASPDGTGLRDGNDAFTKEEAKTLGPFFWFLSQGNTKLLLFASDILESSIIDLHRLSAFHAHSHHESAGFFDQVARHGKPLTDEQEGLFLNNFSRFFNNNLQIAAVEFKKILDLFR